MSLGEKGTVIDTTGTADINIFDKYSLNKSTDAIFNSVTLKSLKDISGISYLSEHGFAFRVHRSFSFHDHRLYHLFPTSKHKLLFRRDMKFC